MISPEKWKDEKTGSMTRSFKKEIKSERRKKNGFSNKHLEDVYSENKEI